MKKYEKYLNSNEWEFIPYNKMADGGSIDDYNTNYNNMNPNIEAEKGEIVKLPNGLVDMINSGGKHSEVTNGSYGTPMNLPAESKILSEKLKDPNTKKSYSKLAKKFETKKDLENLQSPYSDNVNKQTAELNIDMKNKAVDNIFLMQESSKILGKHGVQVRNETMKEYMKGGKVKAENGNKVDNNPPLSGTKGIGLDIFDGDLNKVYSNVSRLGYKGAKDITSIQNWAAENYPREIADYMQLVKPNNKALEDWKKITGSNDISKFNWAAFSPEQRVKAFQDGKWDFRFPLLNRQEIPLNNTTVNNTKTSDVPLIPNANTSGAKKGFNFGNVNFTPSAGFVLPNNYARDAITTQSIEPQYVRPRYLDIQPQLNQINRGVNAFNMNLGSRTGSDISNLLQAQTNAYGQQQQIFGQKYNYDRGQDQWAEGINTQTKMNIDQFNLNNYIQNARNPQLQREANIQMDKNNRMAEQIGMNTDIQHEQRVIDYLANIYDPAYANANLYSFIPQKKNGGKVKLNTKKMKKVNKNFH